MARRITVVGTGSASAPPDTCRITLGVGVTRPSVGDASAEADQAMQAVLAVLEARQVSRDDVRTVEYAIHPEYEHGPEGRRCTGFRVRNQVEALIRSTSQIGEVLAAVVAAGGDAVEMQGLVFEVADPAGPAAEARRLAWEDARARAAQLAELAGSELGGVRSIDESIAGLPAPRPGLRMAMAEAAAVPLEPGATIAVSNIRVTFDLDR